ncbi:hypothetical protein SAY86_001620 [Trapa natans]|uniref:Uncharacterized protein n=1 Tax=Trapa natans TaxID=22666 RepID=A0AAN7LEN1_TRANT|nr:hypothetical protein SAY86_001620 [Trapa natans]
MLRRVLAFCLAELFPSRCHCNFVLKHSRHRTAGQVLVYTAGFCAMNLYLEFAHIGSINDVAGAYPTHGISSENLQEETQKGNLLTGIAGLELTDAARLDRSLGSLR